MELELDLGLEEANCKAALPLTPVPHEQRSTSPYSKTVTLRLSLTSFRGAVKITPKRELRSSSKGYLMVTWEERMALLIFRPYSMILA